MELRMPTCRVYTSVLLLASSALALAQTRPEYGIREDYPPIGSAIRRLAVGPTEIPVNLPYEALSPKDRAKFNENYVSVHAGDEPPFPRGGLQAVLDPIRKAQAKLLVHGSLFLAATVNPSGVAIKVTAYGSPSPEMTKFASEVLLVTKFKPAVCGGKFCEMDFPLHIDFKLNP